MPATWDRFAAAAGMVSVVFFVIAGLLYGDTPDVSSDASAIAEFFAENRDQVLWAVFIQGFAVLALIVFTAALVVKMRDAGELLLAVTTALAFALALSLGSVAALTRAALAFTIAEDAGAETASAFFDFAAIVDTSQNIVSAGIFLAVGAAALRSGFVARWWGWVSGAAALWAIATSTAWNRDGFWSPDAAGFVNLVVYISWIGVTSLLLTLAMRGRPAR